MLAGLLGLTLSMIGFGLAREYWALVLARCVEGALNGNIGVSKSMMAEITDPTNRGRGFAFLPMIWALGGTLGYVNSLRRPGVVITDCQCRVSAICRPIIGGVFSRPADRWPAFRHSSFWSTYPYFLPCAVPATFTIFCWFIAYFYLKEVRPNLSAVPQSCLLT